MSQSLSTLYILWMKIVISFQATHGSPGADVRHVGDFGNLMTPVSGPTDVFIIDREATLDTALPNSIVNRAFVVHALEDDLGLGGDAGSLATGNAGGRLACGLINLGTQYVISVQSSIDIETLFQMPLR